MFFFLNCRCKIPSSKIYFNPYVLSVLPIKDVDESILGYIYVLKNAKRNRAV